MSEKSHLTAQETLSKKASSPVSRKRWGMGVVVRGLTSLALLLSGFYLGDLRSALGVGT